MSGGSFGSSSTSSYFGQQPSLQLRIPGEHSAFSRYLAAQTTISSQEQPVASIVTATAAAVSVFDPSMASPAAAEGESEHGRAGPATTTALVAPAEAPDISQSQPRKKTKTSRYKGVSFYKRINRWETHIWSEARNLTMGLEGKQIYIGSCSTEEAGARIYDRAFIKYRGRDSPNFPYSDYEQEIPQWINLDDEEFVKMLRDMSRGESKLWFTPEILQQGKKFWGPRWRPKASIYRGVYLMKATKKWVASIRVDRRQIRLGCTDTEEEAGRTYDRAAIRFFGENAALNFDLNDYREEMPRWISLEKDAFLVMLREMVKDNAQSNREQLQIQEASSSKELESERPNLNIPQAAAAEAQARLEAEEIEASRTYNRQSARVTEEDAAAHSFDSRAVINFIGDIHTVADHDTSPNPSRGQEVSRDSDINLELSLGPSSSTSSRRVQQAGRHQNQ